MTPEPRATTLGRRLVRRRLGRVIRPSAITATLAGISCLFFSIGCGGGVAKPSPFVQGNLLLDEGRPKAALEAYDLARADRPDDFRLSFNMASAHHDVFLRQKDRQSKAAQRAWKSALSHYDRVLELSPGNARAVSSRAVLLRDGGRLPDALSFLAASAAEGDEGRVLPLWTHGVLLRDADPKNSEAAMQKFRAALEENEEHVPSIVALSELLTAKGRDQEAREVVDEGIRLVPYNLTLTVLNARLAVREAEVKSQNVFDRKAWETARRRVKLAHQTAPSHFWVADAMAKIQTQLEEFESALKWTWKARELGTDKALEEEGMNAESWHRDLKRRLLDLYPRVMALERSR